jgi:molecular chaperone GrpE
MSKKEKARPADAGRPAEEPDDDTAAERAAATDAAGDEAESGEDGGTGTTGPELTPDEQLAEMTDRWLRTRADAENARRRARLDVEEARKHGAANLIQSLLPVLDSLQRALATRPEGEGANDTVWEGLALTEQMLVATLAAHGVTPIDASPGSPFDPNSHQALLEQPSSDQAPGTIVMELVRGYRLHDRLLREAQVTVATRPTDPAGTPPEGDPDADV